MAIPETLCVDEDVFNAAGWSKQDIREYMFERCQVLRKGEDATLVAWGGPLREALAAAEALAGEGIGCEVIDLATINRGRAQILLIPEDANLDAFEMIEPAKFSRRRAIA